MVGRTAIDSRADRLHVEVLRLALQIRNGLVANLHPCVREPLLARPSCSEAALTGRASHVQPRARLGSVAATNALFDVYARAAVRWSWLTCLVGGGTCRRGLRRG